MESMKQEMGHVFRGTYTATIQKNTIEICSMLAFCYRLISHSMGINSGAPLCVASSPLHSKKNNFSTSSIIIMKLVLTEWQLWIFNSNSQ